MRPSLSLLAVALWLTVPVAAQAAVSASQADALKTTLTPLGGERAGNAAGGELAVRMADGWPA